MSGHTPWREINHKATAEQLEQARNELREALTLGELRRAREMTQTQLAESLETTQPAISAIEQRTDLYLSTLRSYIEALGGHLEITAAFPDGTVPISSFTELAERTIEFGVRIYNIDNGIVRAILQNLRESHNDDAAASELAEEFDALMTGRVAALHIEPGDDQARALYEVVCVMNPPSGRRHPPFARLRDDLAADLATRLA